MSEEEIVPWTDRQFANAMRNAGWKNNGQGMYIHDVHGTEKPIVYMAWTWFRELGTEDWKQWAAIRQTPPPF